MSLSEFWQSCCLLNLLYLHGFVCLQNRCNTFSSSYFQYKIFESFAWLVQSLSRCCLLYVCYREHRDNVKAESVRKSPIIKKVRKFLSPEIVTPQSSPEVKQASRHLTNSELHECLLSVESCGNISQIYLLMAKLSRSHPGVSFRGMKFCLARLKKLKSARNLNKEQPDRIRDNKRLLLRGKKAVRKFLAKNQPNESTERKGKTFNYLLE